jgi:sugar phosphate isomerase/epimerase
MKIGVCYPFQKVAKLTSCPFDFIEESVIDFLKPEEPESVFQETMQDVEKCSVPILTANRLLPADLKCVGKKVKEERLENYLKTAFRRAKMVGIKLIVVGSGRSRSIPKDVPLKASKREFTDKLKQWGDLAGEYDIKIAIEPLCRAETNLLNTLAEAAELVREVRHPQVGLLADLYHMHCEGESAETILSINTDIWHVHIAEHRNRAQPGYYSEDFTDFFKALRDIGYDGLISIECRWQNFTDGVNHAIEYTKNQWDMI